MAADTKYQPPAFVKNYAPRRFAGLVHQTKNLELLGAALQKRLGFIYLTDDGADGNPWDRLPTYWIQEIEQVRKLNK